MLNKNWYCSGSIGEKERAGVRKEARECGAVLFFCSNPPVRTDWGGPKRTTLILSMGHTPEPPTEPHLPVAISERMTFESCACSSNSLNGFLEASLQDHLWSLTKIAGLGYIPLTLPSLSWLTSLCFYKVLLAFLNDINCSWIHVSSFASGETQTRTQIYWNSLLSPNRSVCAH